jgi:SSS family solute:Na+ symporter
VVSPGILQKVYGAKDDRAVRRGVFATAIALFLFAWIPPLLGMAARALHPGLANHELALPTVLVRDLPPLLGALGLAAVVSAEISSADAVLFMLSTSLSQDLYRRFIRPAASEQQVLRTARGAAVAAGAAGVLIASLAPTVVGVLSVFYSILTVSLFVPVVAGLYVRRAGTHEAAAAIGTGCVTLLAAQIATGGKGVFALPPAFLGLAAAGLAFGLVLRLRSLRA